MPKFHKYPGKAGPHQCRRRHHHHHHQQQQKTYPPWPPYPSEIVCVPFPCLQEPNPKILLSIFKINSSWRHCRPLTGAPHAGNATVGEHVVFLSLLNQPVFFGSHVDWSGYVSCPKSEPKNTETWHQGLVIRYHEPPSFIFDSSAAKPLKGGFQKKNKCSLGTSARDQEPKSPSITSGLRDWKISVLELSLQKKM